MNIIASIGDWNIRKEYFDEKNLSAYILEP